MRFPWVNTALLLLIPLQLVSGFLGFTTADPPRFLFQLHGIGGFALVVLLAWKGIIILDSYRRELRFELRRYVFLLLTLALIAVLLTGLFWTWDGPRYFRGLSLLTWHVILAVAILGLFAWHTWYMRFILKASESRDRRFLLRTGLIGLGGLLLWKSSGLTKIALALRGAERRITGSYETGSFTGNFPGVIWLSDRVDPIAKENWLLEIEGAVQLPHRYSLEGLLNLTRTDWTAVLDCTGGWYTNQVWSGISLADLIAAIEVRGTAKSVSVISISGYSRKFPLADAGQLLLATHVAGMPLTHSHGAPLRLVAPGYRGFSWVKWVSRLQFNETGSFWQPPLPLQ